MNLIFPTEPKETKTWMLSLKNNSFTNDGTKKDDAYILWAGNKLPKYLWDHWKDDLKPLGINWQKFMRILHHRTDVGVMWYQGTLPWADFVQKVVELMNGPIGKEASGTASPSGSSVPPQDIGALQIPAFSDWEPFERFCRDLWARIWMNPELQRNGRTGQAQAGVDVYGDIKKQAGISGGVQCKKRDAFADDSLTVAELQRIVEDAKIFTPTLREFVVAYTGKSDVRLQTEARRLTELNIAQGIFTVRVCSWDDIKDMLGTYPELLDQYHLVATGVSAKAVEEVKRTSDLILKLQVEQSAATKDTAQGVSSVREDINAVGELVKLIASGGDLAGEYGKEIDEIRDLINANRPKEALDRIEALEKRLNPEVAGMIKFRILTNKAASLAALGNEEKAGMLFIEAFQYNSEDEKALCNKSLGYLFVGQREEAAKIVEQILQKNPLSQRANELLAYAAAPFDKLQSIIERIPEVLRKNESVAYAIAHAAREREMEPEILHWLEVAVDNSDPSKPAPNLRATLATAILQAFEKRHDVQSGMHITSADKERLERALALLDNAIGTLENSETMKYRANWVGNRAVAHKLLGNRDKALADAEFAIKLEPNNPGFLRQKAFLLYEQGKSEEAIVIFKQILDNPKTPEAALLLAGICHEREEDNSAIPILEESIKNTKKPRELLSDEKRLLIHAYMRKDQFDPARKLANELRASNPGSVTDLVIAARIEKRANDLNAHNQLLNDARTYVSDDTPIRGLFELADELYASKRYADAWPLYEKLVDPRSGSSLVSKLIYSYYEAEVYEKALEAARSVPEKEKSRFIYDIEVSILDSMGNLKGAIATSEKYITDHSEDLAFKVKWATYLLRDGQLDKLDAFLKGPIDLAQLPDDLKFNATGQLAWLYTQRNMSIRALEIAYVLRKNSPRNGDAHTTYMSIFFDREKTLDDQFSPTSVGVDTAIAVEEDGSPRRWYVIEETPGSDKDALSPNDPLAKRLMGKKVNEEIVRDEGKPSETRLKVTEIKSKYVHALHETMAMFPHLFGEEENPPFKRFTVKTDSSTEQENRDQLMKMLDQTVGHDEHILRVQKLYEEGKLTIGTFANLIGRDPITIWGGLVNNPRLGIRCCAGTLEERQDAIKTVKYSKTVAVDLTALLTLGNMDRLSILRNSFEEVFIAQSTIDILTQEIAQKNGMSSKGFITVWKESGQYFRQEVTTEDIQKQITFLQKIKDWIAANCTVAPMAEILKLPKERRERLYETIGTSFVDTMMIAKERNCPLYSDDHGTRSIALHDFAVKGFWTQVLAIIAVEKELITTDDMEKINVSLCELRYRHTTISGRSLLYAAKSAGWVSTGPFTTVLAGITGPSIELVSAMGVAVEFFYQLWKEPTISDLQREALVFAALDAIAQQKNRLEVIKYAGSLIPARFRLSPVAGNHLLRLITAWRSIRN
ncbi:MAG: hypothetical protein Q7S11_04110 [bacterium]|nr:hypothetical protein [bacterium]